MRSLTAIIVATHLTSYSGHSNLFSSQFETIFTRIWYKISWTLVLKGCASWNVWDICYELINVETSPIQRLRSLWAMSIAIKLRLQVGWVWPPLMGCVTFIFSVDLKLACDVDGKCSPNDREVKSLTAWKLVRSNNPPIPSQHQLKTDREERRRICANGVKIEWTKEEYESEQIKEIGWYYNCS